MAKYIRHIFQAVLVCLVVFNDHTDFKSYALTPWQELAEEIESAACPLVEEIDDDAITSKTTRRMQTSQTESQIQKTLYYNTYLFEHEKDDSIHFYFKNDNQKLNSEHYSFLHLLHLF